MRDAGCLVGGTDPRGGKQRGVCGPDRIGGGKSPERNTPKRILPREGIYGRYRTERIRIARASRPPSGGPSSSGPRPQAGALRSRQLQRPFPHSGLGHEMSFGNGKEIEAQTKKEGGHYNESCPGAMPRLDCGRLTPWEGCSRPVFGIVFLWPSTTSAESFMLLLCPIRRLAPPRVFRNRCRRNASTR